MTDFTEKIAKSRLSKQKKAEIERRHAELMALLTELLNKDPKVSIGKITAESDKEAIKSISEAVKLLLTVNEQTKTLGGQFGGISSLLDKLTRRLESVPTEFTLSDTRPDRTDEILAALKELGNLNIDFPKFPEAPEVDTKSVVEAVNKVERVLQDILARPQAVGLGSGSGGAGSGGDASLSEQEAQTALLTTIDADTGAIATDLAAIEVLLTTIEGNQLADGHNVTVDNASLAITAASLPLPTGAATSANQTTIIGHVDGLEGLLATIDADTSTLAGAVAGTEVQVDIVTAPTLTTQEVRPSVSAVANVTMTGSSVTLAASNTDRKGLYIFNYSGGTIHVKLGTTASSTSFTVEMVDNAYYELPQPIYTGIVTAIGTSGDVSVTEID